MHESYIMAHVTLVDHDYILDSNLSSVSPVDVVRLGSRNRSHTGHPISSAPSSEGCLPLLDGDLESEWRAYHVYYDFSNNLPRCSVPDGTQRLRIYIISVKSHNHIKCRQKLNRRKLWLRAKARVQGHTVVWGRCWDKKILPLSRSPLSSHGHNDKSQNRGCRPRQ